MMYFKYFSIKEIKNFINSNNLAINKKFGQNFLINAGVVDTIITNSKLNQNDLAIEIGCGLGSLTHKLIEKKCRVLGFEIDRAYIKLLKEQFNNYDNFKLYEGDFLKEIDKAVAEINFKDYDRIIYFGNLPYYITSKILDKIFTTPLIFDELFFMMQKEVAERITSKEDCKNYGSLTIFCQYYSTIKIVANISSKSFYPAPKVNSAVLHFKKNDKKVNLLDEKFFFKTAKSLFLNRRKNIKNCLLNSPILNIKNADLINLALNNVNVKPEQRGEQLSIDKIAELSNELFNISKIN